MVTDLDKIATRLDRASAGAKHTALGMCIFAGGFSLGMEDAGFQIAGHLEDDRLQLGIEASRQRWPVHVGSFESWRQFGKRLRDDGIVPDVAYANPPCAAFAGTGNHEGTADDICKYLFQCSYGMAEVLQPTIWTWELVPAVLTKARGFLDAMAYRVASWGYKSYAFLTTSAIHGGFQDRRRFHFIASKVELDFDGVYEREPAMRKRVFCLGDALGIVEQHGVSMTADHFPELENNTNLYKGAFTSILPFCPPGAHLRDVPPSVMREHYRPRGVAWTGDGVPGFAHTRGREDRPSPNVLGGHTIFHPKEDRYLTPRECATVMGFPLDWKFSEGTKAYAEIGKGLCVHNAAFVGRVLHDALDRDVSAVPGRKLNVIDWRNRGTKLELRMSKTEQREWFSTRHGFVPVEMEV